VFEREGAEFFFWSIDRREVIDVEMNINTQIFRVVRIAEA
jgi:hypothetical protein